MAISGDTAVVGAYRDDDNGADSGSATIHGHVRTLRAFFNWLVAEGLAQNNPARDLKPPKVSRKVVSTISDEEIGAILNTFSTSPSDARYQTLFMLL
ncbi:hypothetical protein ACFLV0_04155, partial [Chloroflexota bacterium]